MLEFHIDSKSVEKSKYDESELKILKLALSELEDIDRLIIKLRFYDELSWKKVNEALESKGLMFNDQYIRQKGLRAFKKLQTNYK
ncbi:MAG: hypothetical protein AAF383_16060 [Cyanobacteria bacterium P01_A01_bin.83]